MVSIGEKNILQKDYHDYFKSINIEIQILEVAEIGLHLPIEKR